MKTDNQLIQEMEPEYSPNQTCQPSSLTIAKAERPETAKIVSPICKLSPTHKGSVLYDSFELQAVVRQLNKTILGTKSFSSPPYITNLRSPFRWKKLNQIYKENKNSPKRLTGSKFSSATGKTVDGKNGKTSGGAWIVTKGVVTSLWKKVTRGLLNNKGKGLAGSPRRSLP